MSARKLKPLELTSRKVQRIEREIEVRKLNDAEAGRLARAIYLRKFKPMIRFMAFLLLTASAFAQSGNVTYTFTDFQQQPQSVRRVTQTPIEPFADYSGAILSIVPNSLVTFTNGGVTFSNTVYGYAYRVQLDTPFGSTVRTCGFPATLTGNVNGRDYLGDINRMNFFYLYPFRVSPSGLSSTNSGSVGQVFTWLTASTGYWATASGSGQTNWPLVSITNAAHLTNWSQISTGLVAFLSQLGSAAFANSNNFGIATNFGRGLSNTFISPTVTNSISFSGAIATPTLTASNAISLSGFDNTNTIYLSGASLSAVNGHYDLKSSVSGCVVWTNSTANGTAIRTCGGTDDYTVTNASGELYGGTGIGPNYDSNWEDLGGGGNSPISRYSTNHVTNAVVRLDGGTLLTPGWDTNSLFVSSSSGNDSTAQIGRPDLAWATVSSALSVAVSNSAVFVLPGEYVETNGFNIPSGVSVIGSGRRVTRILRRAGGAVLGDQDRSLNLTNNSVLANLSTECQPTVVGTNDLVQDVNFSVWVDGWITGAACSNLVVRRCTTVVNLARDQDFTPIDTGVINHDPSATAFFEDCTFINNRNSTSGTANRRCMVIKQGTVTFNGCRFYTKDSTAGYCISVVQPSANRVTLNIGQGCEFFFSTTNGVAVALTNENANAYTVNWNVIGGTFVGNGSGLTNLNASNLASGTVPEARSAHTITNLNAYGPFFIYQVGSGSFGLSMSGSGGGTPIVLDGTTGTIQATNLGIGGNLYPASGDALTVWSNSVAEFEVNTNGNVTFYSGYATTNRATGSASSLTNAGLTLSNGITGSLIQFTNGSAFGSNGPTAQTWQLTNASLGLGVAASGTSGTFQNTNTLYVGTGTIGSSNRFQVDWMNGMGLGVCNTNGNVLVNGPRLVLPTGSPINFGQPTSANVELGRQSGNNLGVFLGDGSDYGYFAVKAVKGQNLASIAGGKIGWSANATVNEVPPTFDTAMIRGAAGQVQVTTGDTGNLGDLQVSKLTTSSNTVIGSATSTYTNKCNFQYLTNPITDGGTFTNGTGGRLTVYLSVNLTDSTISGAPGYCITNTSSGQYHNLTNSFVLLGVVSDQVTIDMSPNDVLIGTNKSSGSASAALDHSFGVYSK